MNEMDLMQEILTWEYLAGTLTQEHQQSVKDEILRKADNLKYQLKQLRDQEEQK